MHKVMYIATVDLEETDWTHFPATTEELLVTTKAAPATTKATICCIVFYIKCRCINVRRRSVDCLLHCSNTFFEYKCAFMEIVHVVHLTSVVFFCSCCEFHEQCGTCGIFIHIYVYLHDCMFDFG